MFMAAQQDQPKDPDRELLLREHQYISESLAGNRKKGVDRFNLYIATIGFLFGISGLKDWNLFAGGRSAWVAFAGLVFLCALGLLMLLTLIRRSVVTDSHLQALQRIRDLLAPKDSPVRDAIPTLNIRDAAKPERMKLRYYKLDPEERTPAGVSRYLRGEIWKSYPYYGDLIENICAVNSLVIAFTLTWIMHGLLHRTEQLWLAVLLAALTVCWLWTTQMMLVWYKHSRHGLLREEGENAALLADQGEDPAMLGKDADYLSCFRSSMAKIAGAGLLFIATANAAVILAAPESPPPAEAPEDLPKAGAS